LTVCLAAESLVLTAANVLFNNNFIIMLIYFLVPYVLPLVLAACLRASRRPDLLGPASVALAAWGFDRFVYSALRVSLVPGLTLPVRSTPTSVVAVVVLVAWVVGGVACLIAWRGWVASEGYRRARPAGAVNTDRSLARLISLGSLEWFLVVAQCPPCCSFCLLPNPGYLFVLERLLTADKLQGNWQVTAAMEDGEVWAERNGAVLTLDRGTYHQVASEQDVGGSYILYFHTTTEWESPLRRDTPFNKLLLLRDVDGKPPESKDYRKYGNLFLFGFSMDELVLCSTEQLDEKVLVAPSSFAAEKGSRQKLVILRRLPKRP
jgi:hypothetical protein